MKHTTFLMFLLFLFCPPVQADRGDVDAAAKCSAQFFVMTALEQIEPKLGEFYTRQGQFASDMASIYSGESGHAPLTMSQLSMLKQPFLDEIKNTKGSSMSLASMSRCAGWIVAVGTALQADKPKSKERFVSVVLSAARPNDRFPFPYESESQFSQLVETAKQLWFKNGAVTPRDLREALDLK